MVGDKLSICARADDVNRKMAALMDTSTEEYLLKLAKYAQDLCSELRAIEDERTNLRKRNTELEQANMVMMSKLKNAQEGFKKEIALKESVIREREALRKKLCQVREILKEDLGAQAYKANKVLSCLDLNLEKVDEINESGGDYLSDNEYDKSDDDILGRPPSLVQLKRIISETPKSNLGLTPISELSQSFVNVSIPLMDATEMGVEPMMVERTEPKSCTRVESSPILSQLRASDMTHFHSQSQLEKRKHKLQAKKVYKFGETCSVCQTNFGFASSQYRCSECHAACHPQCRNRLPLPCVPYVPKSAKKRDQKGHLTTVADYVSLSCPPCVPALIVHCCQEIERRGLEETGLYRIPGAEEKVKLLRNKILNSKNGMPVLSNEDVMVLCGVVKSFLKSLDDPVISRVLWRQFVDAASQEDPDDARAYLHQAITELPLANKHTLAFLMLHLQRVSNTKACNMPVENLSRVFAPTIVGYSVPAQNLRTEHMPEAEKGIRVMKGLFSLSSDYWNGLLSDRVVTQNSPGPEIIARRQSIGTKVIGGFLESEVLAPKSRMKPLF
ncbi:GTPase-activating protein RacGAP84C-like [Brevipalpus obovatus]|uniref:GTPase-activating protein RacGAP84C-like n=1 Tax=Brevipalpus obovatus TaxID=246614 RepID=UPI003D9ED1D7